MKKIFIGVGIVLVAIAPISLINNMSKTDPNILKENINIVSQDNSYQTYTYITEEIKQNTKNRGIMASYLNEYTPEYIQKQLL